MKQLTLIPKPNKEHGGSLTHKKRKTFKPLDTTKVTHLVLKAHKSISLYDNRDFVEQTIRRQGYLSGVKIYNLSIQHDHIHHGIYFIDRLQYKRFIRALTGILSRRFGRGMWKCRPFTRVVEWGRDYKNLQSYIHQNELEVKWTIPYQLRNGGGQVKRSNIARDHYITH